MSNDAVTVLRGSRPGKVIAVHLNYPSRAAQRGRVPQHASYFLKPSSSLCGTGRVHRPQGTELLAFEAEVALVIGTAARQVAPEDGWSHVGWVTAANDLGLQDLRYADKGSNVRSKGGDGYTPLGPELIEASRVAPDALRVRAWLDGELVQDDTTADLLFSFGHLVADLSRMLTLEVGDVILTGTPAGASVAQPGQRVEVEVSSLTEPTVRSGRLVTEVVDGPCLGQWGAPPRADDAARADAYGQTPAAPAPILTDYLRRRLGAVAVATLSVQLRKRGYDDASIDGVRPLVPGRPIVGTARTLRYIPYRKDLFAAHGGGFNAQKRAIDSVGPGEVLVMEARGDATAGTLGDILALRAQVRGAAGVITDGAVRDAGPVAALGLPVYSSGAHPAVLGRRHVPWETDVTIACGGAAVQVGDIIVADDDGALVIPPALVVEVLEAAEEQEQQERFITEQVAAGHGVDGLYPLGPHWRDAFDRWRAAQNDRADQPTPTNHPPSPGACAPADREDTP
ncbi:fumarylacetoacetate hydrolase family protein [Micromonospora sp. NBC_01412]|uniref:fumarylacetoacetate hydrolase family protein n=1 Tax=Micromonospora sp. NBC_01412 TaxID=2903590 RepID=UPI00324CC79B